MTLEIEATIPDGAPERVVRTVTENSRTPKFEISGFEEEMLSRSDSWQKNQGCSFGPGCPCRSEKPSSRQQQPTEER